MQIRKLNLNMHNVNYSLEIENKDKKFNTHCGIQTRDLYCTKPNDCSLYSTANYSTGILQYI